MNLVTPGALGRVFRGSTEPSYRETILRHQLAERERRERREEIESDAAEDMDFAMAVVSVAEMEEFHIDLDCYDAATIAALQENEIALDLILKQKEEFLVRAFVLPDGRRVFKSEDGIRVFDEFGAELDPADIDPNFIEDQRPKWETYKPILEESIRLIHERRALLDYQEKLDAARERLDAGDMTREEFDKLREELKADMPKAVREQIPELADEQQPEPEAADAHENIDLDITEDMAPTSSTPKLPMPGVG